jgi:hypothetical protein
MDRSKVKIKQTQENQMSIYDKNLKGIADIAAKREQQAKDDMKPKKKKYGSRQNYVRSTRVNESFSEMISAYKESGLKVLANMVHMEEEVDSEDFEKEMKDQKEKFDGKKKGADVAKASVQAVKVEEDVEKQSDRTMNEDSGGFGQPKNYIEINKNEYDKHLSNRISAERNKGIKNLKDTHTKTNRHGWKTHDIVHHHGGQKHHGIPDIAKTTNHENNKSKFYKKSEVKEEAELHEGSTYKLGRASAETKDFPIKHKGEHVGSLQFHASAGKLYHRVSSVIGVSHEKFLNHPEKDNMVNTHVKKHEAEARQHFVKKLKEEVEELDEISTKTLAQAAHAASDPNYMGDKHHDSQKFADYAKRKKDTKSAAAVQGAADAKGHFPRPGHASGFDKMDLRQNRSTQPTMVTKSGKLTKTAQKGLKSRLKNEEFEDETFEVELVLDGTNGYAQETVQERSLSAGEMKKKESVVKSMKKSLSGFKERYGDRAKDVMYATATKMAKKED